MSKRSGRSGLKLKTVIRKVLWNSRPENEHLKVAVRCTRPPAARGCIGIPALRRTFASQEVKLLTRFHSFGNTVETEIPSQAQDAPHDRFCVWFDVDVAHEWRRLDAAVFAACGRPSTPADAELVERLLALNHQRTGPRRGSQDKFFRFLGKRPGSKPPSGSQRRPASPPFARFFAPSRHSPERSRRQTEFS
jgi:hypothetical protein